MRVGPNVTVICVTCNRSFVVYGDLTEKNGIIDSIVRIATDKCCDKPRYHNAEFMFKLAAASNEELVKC